MPISGMTATIIIYCQNQAKEFQKSPNVLLYYIYSFSPLVKYCPYLFLMVCYYFCLCFVGIKWQLQIMFHYSPCASSTAKALHLRTRISTPAYCTVAWIWSTNSPSSSLSCNGWVQAAYSPWYHDSSGLSISITTPCKGHCFRVNTVSWRTSALSSKVSPECFNIKTRAGCPIEMSGQQLRVTVVCVIISKSFGHSCYNKGPGSDEILDTRISRLKTQ